MTYTLLQFNCVVLSTCQHEAREGKSSFAEHRHFIYTNCTASFGLETFFNHEPKGTKAVKGLSIKHPIEALYKGGALAWPSGPMGVNGMQHTWNDR